MGLKACELPRADLRDLTKSDIDRRIDDLAADLAIAEGPEDRVDPDQRFSPRWISAAELARRVRPFIGMN